MAGGLIDAGVRPGDSVALLAGASPAWFAACLAVIAAGGVAAPVDEQSSDEVLKHVLADSGTRLVFTTRDGRQRLQDLNANVRAVLLDADDDTQSWRRFSSGDAALPESDPDDTALLFYTSGTTGLPKGVPLSHGNLAFQVNTLLAADVVTAQDRVLLPLPLHHVYPFVIGLLLPLSLGLPVILPQSLTGPRIVEAIRGEKVTAVVGVPRLYSALYAGIEAQARARGWLAGMLFTACAGTSAWLRRRLGWRAGRWLLRPLHRQFGTQLRILACGGSQLDAALGYRLEGLGWQLAIGYGLTETAPLLTLDPPGAVRMGSVGRPVPGVDLRIDAGAATGRDGAARGSGHGEILARGPNVFRGYRNLPERSAEVFTPDGFFRTGDLGYFDADGYLYITGRVSTLVVTAGGENVQPDDLEAVYAQAPAIREIGVLQQDERLVAVIVPETDATGGMSPTQIEAAVRKAVDRGSRQLASYQRISQYAITREALPRTRLGKLQRHRLAARYEQARQEGKGAGAAGPLPAEEMSDQDRALLENAAAQRAWTWLAGRYPDLRLTPDSSLQLDLGLDSLAWLNLTMEIGQRFGIELNEQAVARLETVRDLLSEVSEQAQAGHTVAQAAPLEHPERVLSAAQRRWLEPPGALVTGLAGGLYYLNRALMRGLFRVRARGLENLPARGSYILAPNHASYLDPFAVAAALEFAHMRELYWGGWVGVAFKSRWRRAFSRIAHVLPIEPQRAASSSLAFGAAVLKRGHNLAWFPEGERSANGELLPFKPGLGMLLAHLQTPVVPVYIYGSFEALPHGRLWPRFKPITVIFGAACVARELADEGQGEQAPERVVSALRARVAALKTPA